VTTGDNQKAKELEDIMTRVASEVRKTFQPNLDALNRAVRRYEKRTTISAFETDARLRDLETRMKDIIALTGAAGRDGTQRRASIFILIKWVCDMVTLPVRSLWTLLTLPAHVAIRSIRLIKQLVWYKPSRKGKEVNGTSKTSRRETQKQGGRSMKTLE
jgi:hypothetical protein